MDYVWLYLNASCQVQDPGLEASLVEELWALHSEIILGSDSLFQLGFSSSPVVV